MPYVPRPTTHPLCASNGNDLVALRRNSAQTTSHTPHRARLAALYQMAKTSSPPKSAAVRVSTRKKQTVARFRPASADIPSDLLEMIRDVACAAAAKSKVPFETSAVTALEEALEPCLEALCEAALAHAQKAGRDEISSDDLKAVAATYIKAK